jgi:HK97 family phage major capsid protein
VARQTFEAWLVEEKDSSVMTRIAQTSAVEALGRSLPMNSTTKSFPRSGGMDVSEVPKGSAYGEDVSVNDEVILTAKKFGKAIRIAEEDIDDSIVNVIETKKTDWASSYAKFFDNACLGTSAAVGAGVPFVSVYRAVTTADAATGYVANANHVASTSAAGALVTYDQLSAVLAVAEGGDSFDEADTVVIAHPSFKAAFRGVRDTQGNPIFIEGLAGTPSTLFGYPVRWTVGAKVTATATAAPPKVALGAKGSAGNPLLIVGSKSALMVGKRSGPESVVIDGRDGASALTDETILKVRARRAFAVAYADAFAVLERTA